MRVKPPVFLDRDGVINYNRADYIRTVEDWIPIPGSIEAISLLSDSNFPVFVVSNQSAIARGYTTKETVDRINNRLIQAVDQHGGNIRRIYYCPHHPDENCNCRKPEVGMLKQAVRDYGIELNGGFLVGDASSDMQLARNGDLFAVMVLTGRGEEELKQMRISDEPEPDHIAENLLEAVKWILKQDKNQSTVIGRQSGR